MKTIPKAIRLSNDEIRFVQSARAAFPGVHGESDLPVMRTMLGLWMLATAARRPGQPAFGGHDPADLAALIRPRVLAVLDFLAEYGKLPRLISASSVVIDGDTALISDEPSSEVLAFDPEAAEAFTLRVPDGQGPGADAGDQG